MDKTGRNGFRIGDLEADNWINKYSDLKSKNKKLIDVNNLVVAIPNIFDNQSGWRSWW